MTDFLPEFVVVGNVNQGKSSIVAALIENVAVPIANYPGTTQHTARYAFRLDGQDLFSIIDTPGFQEARATLAWLKERTQSPADRPAAVRAFVEAHDGGGDDDRFADEVRLLKPITEGASILYVVDASSRFQPSNEAEMEILRWTGQPAMALINRTRERDHSAEWRPVLEQFFNLVRDFDAYGAGFLDRIELLSGFREVRPEWRDTMDRAIAAMQQEWKTRRQKSALLLADFLITALTHVEKREIHGEAPPPGLTEDLDAAYQASQRKFETDARAGIEGIYQHDALERDQGGVELLESDLFSEVSWRVFGLERGQMARYGAAWGALIGGGVDVAVGGLSFLTGAATGALVGGLGGYFASTHVAKTLDSNSKAAKYLFGGDTGRFLFKGPVSSPRYAWMLLDRALVHHEAIRTRSHARQDRLVLDSGNAASTDAPSPRVARLDGKLRDALNQDLMQIIKEGRSGAVSATVREDLANHLLQVLED